MGVVFRAVGSDGESAIHEAGIIHRDLKPSNVILSRTGARLIDFGIARSVSNVTTRLTRLGSPLGTPAYMSPEQFGQASDLGTGSDVFSWGSVVVFAATGVPAFGGDLSNVWALMFQIIEGSPMLDGVPSRLLPLVGAALGKDSSKRPHARELAASLRAT